MRLFVRGWMSYRISISVYKMNVLKTFLSTPYPSIDNRIDFMDHSNSSSGWDWINTNDFKFYLVENGYINNYTTPMSPHNNNHLNCGGCQLESIKKSIIKRRKCLSNKYLVNQKRCL